MRVRIFLNLRGQLSLQIDWWGFEGICSRRLFSFAPVISRCLLILGLEHLEFLVGFLGGKLSLRIMPVGVFSLANLAGESRCNHFSSIACLPRPHFKNPICLCKNMGMVLNNKKSMPVSTILCKLTIRR